MILHKIFLIFLSKENKRMQENGQLLLHFEQEVTPKGNGYGI